RVLLLGDLVADDLLQQSVALGLQLVALLLRARRVAEPAEQVADRLERAARALLYRREHRDDAALHAVQRAPGRLAEVGGQQDQGDDDEQYEDCTATTNLLVVHGWSGSKAGCSCAMALDDESAISSGGAGCSLHSCATDGSPRTPRASDPTRPRRT